MLRRITAKQFQELQLFDALEPSETFRQDYRIALIAQTIANVNRASGQKGYALKDFVLKFGEKEDANPDAPPSEMQLQARRDQRQHHIAVLRAMAAAYSTKGVDA
jgi:hypothetical protein